MQVEFKENGLCVRCELLYEESFRFAQHSVLLAFSSSSKETHGYFKVFSEVSLLKSPFSTSCVSVVISYMKYK